DLGQALRFLGVYGPKDVNLRKSIKEDIMKVNSLLMKTALAAAVASVSFGATAGVLQIPNPSILATEVFGDAKNNANESDLTAITLPRVNFYADAGGDLVTKTAGSHLATVKLTLLGAALFAENYQDPNTWA